MMKSDNETIRKKLEFYEGYGKMIHLKLKTGRFYNGGIVEIKDDVVVIEDRKLGEIPIMFSEIDDVEIYFVRGGD